MMTSKEQYLDAELKPHLFNSRIDQDYAFVCVLSDIHMGANNESYLDEVLEFLNKVGAYVIVGGDSVNMITATSKGIPQEQDIPYNDEQIIKLAEKLKPLHKKGKILAIGEDGNHNSRVVESVFISPNKVLSVLLGDRSLYHGSMLLGMITVGNRPVTYTMQVMHKARKQVDYYDFNRADITVLEHTHILQVREKVVYDWNTIAKTVNTKKVYLVDNGSFMVFPDYSKRANYKPQLPGTHIFRLDGKKRDIQIFRDEQLYHLIKYGYMGKEFKLEESLL